MSSQSLAIIEYPGETGPDPPLLPADAKHGTRVRPLNTLRILDHRAGQFGRGDPGWR